MNEQILQEISEFCRQRGLAESTFGRRAVNDGKLANRLRNGGRITTDTLDRIRAFMARNTDGAAAAPPHAVRPDADRRADGESARAAGCLGPGQRRSAAQFPFLRQPAEISAFREYLLGEMGDCLSRRARTGQHSSTATGVRCSTPASATAPCCRASCALCTTASRPCRSISSARKSASKTSASRCRRWRTASSNIPPASWCSPIWLMPRRRG